MNRPPGGSGHPHPPPPKFGFPGHGIPTPGQSLTPLSQGPLLGMPPPGQGPPFGPGPYMGMHCKIITKPDVIAQ